MEFHLNTGKINVIYPKAYLSLHGLFNSKNFPSLKMWICCMILFKDTNLTNRFEVFKQQIFPIQDQILGQT